MDTPIEIVEKISVVEIVTPGPQGIPGTPGLGAEGVLASVEAMIGQPSGIAPLDSTGKVPAANLPQAAPSVAGTDKQVQINDGGDLGANAGLTFDKSTKILSVQGGVELLNTAAIRWNNSGLIARIEYANGMWDFWSQINAHVFHVNTPGVNGDERNGVSVDANGHISFGFSNSNNYTGDNQGERVSLRADAFGVLSLRGGAYSQTFRAYNTYTDASNYERAKFGWNGNTLEIGTENAGTGSERNIAFSVAGQIVAGFSKNGAGGTLSLGDGSLSKTNGQPFVFAGGISASGCGIGFPLPGCFQGGGNQANVKYYTDGGAKGHLFYSDSSASELLGGFSSAGDFSAKAIGTTALTFATLPATPYAGLRAAITDSTLAMSSANFGAIAAGGGTNYAPVQFDGTKWRVG